MNKIVTLNGYLGGILNASILIPQIYKVYMTKKSKDISWFFIFLSILASIFSILYFEEIQAKPMAYTNMVSLGTRIVLGLYKFKLEHMSFQNSIPENLLES